MCIKVGNDIFKILLAEMKVGTAKLPSSVHLRLENLHTRTQTEQRLHPEDKVEDIAVETVTMEYSYSDGDSVYCMHPETFEQVAVPRRLVGNYERFLDSGAKLRVEFYGEEPIDVLVPRTADAVVVSTGAPLHGDVDSAPKSATLDNGLEVQVPQFIKTGDRVKIDVATGKYLERLH
jgi:elongation factor P